MSPPVSVFLPQYSMLLEYFTSVMGHVKTTKEGVPPKEESGQLDT